MIIETNPFEKRGPVHKNKILILLLLYAFMGLVGCSTKDETFDPINQPANVTPPAQVKPSEAASQENDIKKFHKNFLGIWLIEGSSGEFEISRHNNRIRVIGIDSEDGEKFKTLKISWDHISLKFTVLMPSTGHHLNLTLTIIDENRLHCEFNGDTAGKTLWSRKKTDD